MIVTRQETFVDWSYSGAHANELAATVGNGLLRGYIYFRYAYDMLKAGEKVEREVSFVHLSDGSQYELGTGLSSEKIDIMYEGQTDDGSVTLFVNGKMGVGVSSVTRHVTINYDDGKVPVLDTEQLNGILDDLKQSLTDGMTSTAETVKQELISKVDAVAIDLESKCDSKVVDAKNSLQNSINSLTQELKGLSGKLNARVPVSRWALKQSHVAGGSGEPLAGFYNLIEEGPKNTFGSGIFTFNQDAKGVTVPSSSFPYPRILTVGLSLTLEIPTGFNAPVSMLLIGAKDDNIYARDILNLESKYLTSGGKSSNIQFQLQSYIGVNGSGHPLVDGGFKLVMHNGGSQTIVVVDGSSVHLILN